MSYFAHELTKRINEEIQRLEGIVLAGNLDELDYKRNTAQIYAYKKVVQEFFNDAERAINQENK